MGLRLDGVSKAMDLLMSPQEYAIMHSILLWQPKQIRVPPQVVVEYFNIFIQIYLVY